MIWVIEWKRLFSALKIFKNIFIGYAPIFHFSERFSWLTCVDIFFTSVNKVRCVENSVFFHPPEFVDFSIALEAI